MWEGEGFEVTKRGMIPLVYMHGRVFMTEQVVQQRVDLEKSCFRSCVPVNTQKPGGTQLCTSESGDPRVQNFYFGVGGRVSKQQ